MLVATQVEDIHQVAVSTKVKLGETKAEVLLTKNEVIAGRQDALVTQEAVLVRVYCGSCLPHLTYVATADGSAITQQRYSNSRQAYLRSC